jgi:hypothetical protein
MLDLPEEERLEALQYCMLLLDDENRDVLQCLLYFLHDIAQNHLIHKVFTFLLIFKLLL